jgi:ketosteroid isomerase-like protein
MSQENVEIVKCLLTAPRSEIPDLLPDLLDPAVRLDLSDRVFNPDVYEGYEGIARWRADVDDVWDSYQIEPEEFFDGNDVVVVAVRERGRGKGSGVEVDRHVTFLCRLHSGRVNEIRSYDDRGRALLDAGLED